MKERKVLTLEEILSLDRRPTLQEMIDLSTEDYTKYLYEKGIIPYAPELLLEYLEFMKQEEDDAIWDNSFDIIINNLKIYDPIDEDIVIYMNRPFYKSLFNKNPKEGFYDYYKDYPIDENDEYDITIQKPFNDKMNKYYEDLFNVMPDDFNLYESEKWNNPNNIEKGILINRYGIEVEYSIDNKNEIIFYEKNLDGKYWNPTVFPHKLYYLENLKYYIQQENKIIRRKKTLSLEEVLNLDRRPTLQEMIDLSTEDYTKYLYEKGIIPYAPELLLEYLEFMKQDEDDAVWDNSFDVIVKDLENHSFVDEDIVIRLNRETYISIHDISKYTISEEHKKYIDKDDDYYYYMNLWNVPDNFNLYESEKWNNPNNIEKGILINNYGVEVEYNINNENKLILFEKNINGKYLKPNQYYDLYYLEK